jgi:DNA-binding MltR family transcriptional regulator
MSRGQHKRSVRDLSRDPPAFEDHDEIIKMQNEGPDLVLAITASALIEYEIETLIIARMKRRDPNTILKCFENNGPMSGLYSKSVLAYAMGILDEIMFENVNIVRLIRNAFAHARRPIKFGALEVMAELRKVRLPSKKRSRLYADLHFVKTKTEAPQARFSILCSRINIFLLKKGTAAAKRRADYLSRKSRYVSLATLGRYSGLGLINRPTNSLNALLQLAQSHTPDRK